METYNCNVQYTCEKCGKTSKTFQVAYIKKLDVMEMVCECGHRWNLEPVQKTAINEVLEFPDKQILLG